MSIPGTGGMPAMAATGGRAMVIGTGGAVASASGGVIGSGGVSHSGGARGTGGSTGTTAECQQYMHDYDAEIPAARACKLNGNQAKACAVLVPQKLAGCGSSCMIYVDKANMLDQIQKKWDKAGCVAPPCGTATCNSPSPSICSAETELCTN
ncbi:MAG: hypothetical protein H7X95_01080 [Deltaproteobacteria bacterium]|nr:hypothetical protein [Deltaproteobacteria bacterium]